jgi:peptidoglycan hydrolase CwlO-like protein
MSAMNLSEIEARIAELSAQIAAIDEAKRQLSDAKKAARAAEKEAARIPALNMAAVLWTQVSEIAAQMAASCAAHSSDDTARLAVQFYDSLKQVQKLSSDGQFTAARGRELLGLPQPTKPQA